jgi:hypothetical protein
VVQVDDLAARELVLAVVLLRELWPVDRVLEVAGHLGELLLDFFSLEVGLEGVMFDLYVFLIEFLSLIQGWGLPTQDT